MTILVTGGAGFLGSHLCKRLLNESNKVICLDNLSTGNMRNIEHLLDNPDFRFINHDIVNPIDIKIDQIYNLACPASPLHYQSDPVKTAKTNVIGILNMLELAKKYKALILQASTSEVYGDPKVHPQPEDYWGYVNPDGVRSCYDEGKRMAETLCFDYCRQYGVNIKIVRIFNTYGPNMSKDDGRVVSNFILQALNGQDITIYGDGSQTRSFCYVDDQIDGLIRMMESTIDFHGPCNIGNPQEFTIKQLAEYIINITCSNSTIVYLPLPQDDPVQRKPVILIADTKLNWKPVVMLNEGLIKTISYYKDVIGVKSEQRN